MKLKFSVILSSLITILALSPSAYAGAESGFYLGAGAGSSNIKGNVDEDDFDLDANAFKILGGYNFGIVPLIDLGLEAAYVNMGRESVGNLEFSQTSLNGFGLAGLSFGPFGIFAKLGLAAWDAKSKSGNLSKTISGTDPVYGIGARLQIMKVSGRIEFEYYDQDGFDDVYMSSLSFLYTF